jgi:hypothetical protein
LGLLDLFLNSIALIKRQVLRIEAFEGVTHLWHIFQAEDRFVNWNYLDIQSCEYSNANFILYWRPKFEIVGSEYRSISFKDGGKIWQNKLSAPRATPNEETEARSFSSNVVD